MMGILKYIKAVKGIIGGSKSSVSYSGGTSEGSLSSYYHNKAKEQVGMASRGTTEYYRNAATVLSQHAGPGMRSDTKAKLESLANSSDPSTRQIARNALNGQRDYVYEEVAQQMDHP